MKLTANTLFTFNSVRPSLEATKPHSPERQKLLDAGCQSVWIAIAIQENPTEGTKLLELYAEAKKLSDGHDKREREYDEYCESWYGQHDSDKLKLIKDTTKKLTTLVKKFKG